MSKSSKRWLQTHRRDPFVKQSQQSHYRSRAVYKLQEIDQQDRLFKLGQIVVDLGAAPGSWSQYASEQVGAQGKVIAVDMLPMQSINNIRIINGDFTDTNIYNTCIKSLSDQQADLVISDMAPNLTGIKDTDQARIMHLGELVYAFSIHILKPGGCMLVKLFQGQGTDQFKRELLKHFQQVNTRKPKASRSNSREIYILAKGYVV